MSVFYYRNDSISQFVGYAKEVSWTYLLKRSRRIREDDLAIVADIVRVVFTCKFLFLLR